MRLPGARTGAHLHDQIPEDTKRDELSAAILGYFPQ